MEKIGHLALVITQSANRQFGHDELMRSSISVFEHLSQQGVDSSSMVLFERSGNVVQPLSITIRLLISLFKV